MKMLISISLSILFLATAIAKSIPDSLDEDNQWEMFKIKFHKVYKSEAEEAARKLIFARKVQQFALHNERFDKGDVTYRKGVNQFTDLTDDEILQMRKYSYPGNDEGEINLIHSGYEDDLVDDVDLPEKFDWREKGAVTKVRDQGNCEQSDWAFSAIGALETQLFKLEKPLTELSEQELIDCSQSCGNAGCYGGTVQKAFRFIQEKGISTENSYPYKGMESNGCQKKGENSIAKGSEIECKPIPSNYQPRMKQAVIANGPLLAMINASQPSFSSYEGGIYYDDECSKAGDHNVLIVGYGKENADEYWIVKNSWGESWGEKGYMRIKRNTDTCVMVSNVNYVNVTLKSAMN